ncbi:MAG: DUF2933 domain-containing protein [Sporichthyaceae bacterium]
MTQNKYPLYGLVIATGAVLAVWAGLPPSFLLILLVCPLMMFFMMRGMHGNTADHGETKKTADPERAQRAMRPGSDTDTAPDHTTV